ncbi:hypothetical protein C8Q76DRAFT_794419 [Earliella scabrosa]|nr:hypothetical protein C8Q76DRAFT_794419 [Earliella scabrosa]
MSTANINDASAIQALLDQLKSSEVWQKVANPTPEATLAVPPTASGSTTGHVAAQGTSSSNAAADARAGSYQGTHDGLQTPQFSREPPMYEGSSNAGRSVASLLSQLQASGTFSAAASPSGTSASASAPTPAAAHSAHSHPFSGGSVLPRTDAVLPSPPKSTHPPAPHTPRQNLRACTFQQALPHLARLSEDPEFVKALTAMRTEQAELERQLWRERRDIQRKHEERVKAARTKASIIGVGLTQYEADALTDSFRSELLKFDRERVLPAWDGLVTKQQAALEALGVPAMFPATEAPDRERQQKVMQVLAGLVGNEGDGRVGLLA